MGWTWSKNGRRKEIRRYMRVNRGEEKEGEDLD
jgi:hypothetical protein